MLRRIALIFVVSVLVNYAWELGQAPLYVGMDDFRGSLWHCFVAALGDGVLVLALFLVGAIVFRRADWFRRPGLHAYGLMIAAGLVIGVLVEWLGLHVLRRWAYGPGMPLVPWLGVGLVPTAQMLLLPPLIFWIVARSCGPHARNEVRGDGQT